MILQEPVEQADILIVDDTPDNLNLLSRILKEHEYTVRTAINGKLALQSVQAAPPALILLDVMMPEMDGYEVCRHLKADEQMQNIPVIFLSGLHELPYKMRAFEVGGLDYITKPFHAEEVIARIRNYLAIQTTQRQFEKHNAQLQEELSERRALEAIISQAKKEWEYTFDAVPDLIFILDRDFRILRINKAAAHYLQLEPKDCIGQTCYSLFHGTVHAPATCPHARMLNEHQECTQEMCNDFEDRPFLVTASPVLDDEKNPIGSVHIARDISTFKKSEELLLHAKEAADQANRTKSHFLANMSHELRTPLNAVIGFSQLLADHPKLNERERENVEIILQNGERLLNVINDALDFSRMEDGCVSLQMNEEERTDKIHAKQPLAINALKTIPQDLLERLEHAAITADINTIFGLIEEIQRYAPPVADTLTGLTKEFAYHTILRTIQQGKDMPEDGALNNIAAASAA